MFPFRTVLPAPAAEFRIGHEHHLLTLGSCFVQHIGQQLERYQFSLVRNPFGILYNPVAIADGLKYLLSDRRFTADDLFLHQELWHSFAHHGHFSDPDQQLALGQMNQALDLGRQQLGRCNRLLITLGTAQVFYHKKTGKGVANCHKLPGKAFERRRLGPDEIKALLCPIFEQLQERSPDLKILLTVSPIRHLRDGMVDNQRSKASLLLAIAELEEQCPAVTYFPAYELLLDDLRDYRFYDRDLVHPNAQAIQYIWSVFGQTYFGESTATIITQIEKIRLASEHRPLHPQRQAHQHFIHQQLAAIQQLEASHPFLDFAKEKEQFSRQLR